MSAIPPNWMASGIQSLDAQKRATDTAVRGAASEARAGSPFADALKDVIETTDRDAQVDADAGGTGGQGRQHSESAESGHGHSQPETENEIAEGGLDLTA